MGASVVKQARSVVNLLNVGVKGKQDVLDVNVQMVYCHAQCFAIATVPTVTDLNRPM